MKEKNKRNNKHIKEHVEDNKYGQQDSIHITTDATFNNNESCLASVAKISNAIIHAWFLKLQSNSPMEAKAEAIQLACQVAQERRWSNIKILSDAKLVVQALKAPQDAPWQIKSLVMSINCVLYDFHVGIVSG